MRCCRNILMNNELKYLHIYVVGAIAQLLVMRNTYSYLLCEETAFIMLDRVHDALECQPEYFDVQTNLFCLKDHPHAGRKTIAEPIPR